MNKLHIIVQDLSKEDSTVEFILKPEENFNSFKNKVAEYLSISTSNFLLYSQNTFLDKEETVKMDSISKVVYAIPEIANKNEYTLVSSVGQKKVPIEQLREVIENRALHFAKGIKNKNQKFNMKRGPPITLL